MDRYNELKEVFKKVLIHLGTDADTRELSLAGLDLIDTLQAEHKGLGEKLKGLETKGPSFLELADQANIRKGF